MRESTVSNGMSSRLFGESVLTIRAILCQRWNNFLLVHFMEKKKSFIPVSPMLLCPLIFLRIFLTLHTVPSFFS